MREELGVILDPHRGKLVRQVRRDEQQDFYDVWVFPCEIDLKELRLQSTEVIDAQWASKRKLLELYNSGKLHPLINYIDDILALSIW